MSRPRGFTWLRRQQPPTAVVPAGTQYTDTYAALNPHLFDPSVGEYTRPALAVSDTVRTSLTRVFKFSSHYFSSPHTVLYRRMKIQSEGPETALPVLDVNYQWSTEYYHFITEVLPAVLLMSRSFPTAVIRCRVSRFTRPMLEWFGIRNPIDPDVSLINARRISVPTAECGNPPPERIALLRDIVLRTCTFASTHGILIRRHGERVLVNESEVYDQLKATYPELEWVVFDMENVSDTAALFSKAAVVAGPHGAGFTNMLFCSPDVRIIEFMPDSEPNVCYWHLASVLGVSYTMVSSPVVGPKNALHGTVPRRNS